MPTNLHGPRNDLDIAQEAVEAMTTTKVFTVFYRTWQDFLIRIERAWEATERGIRGSPGYQAWFRPYAQQKRRDPLLVFLSQARHAETHAINPTMDHPLRLVLRDKYGHPFSLREVRSTLDHDGALTIDIETEPEDSLLSYEVAHVPSPPRLIRFRNRGVWYEPPTSHLGAPLTSIDPLTVARLGLAFYSAFVKEADYRFFNSRPTGRRPNSGN